MINVPSVCGSGFERRQYYLQSPPLHQLNVINNAPCLPYITYTNTYYIIAILYSVTAVIYCDVIYCDVINCNVIYYDVIYCDVIYCTVIYCDVIYCTVIYCNVIYCNVIYCTVLYSTVIYCDLIYCDVVHCDFIYCDVIYCTEKNNNEIYYTLKNIKIIYNKEKYCVLGLKKPMSIPLSESWNQTWDFWDMI